MRTMKPYGKNGLARWEKHIKDRAVSPEDAVSCVRSGDRVWIHPGCAEPEHLVKALVNHWDQLEDVEIVHLMIMGSASYVHKDMVGHFRHNAFFLGKNVREAVNEGRADYIPIFLSEVPRLFYEGRMQIDLAMIHVSPPDEHGFCSLGVGVDCTLAAADTSKMVIAQVNPQMPRTLGDSFIHVNKIDYFVEVDDPIIELPRLRMSELHKEIGKNVASLIDNGSTLQMGIGGIPDAVLFFLQDKKDLGIHTEMFSDGVIELVENGIITNDKKTLHRGKSVVSFVLGSRMLYKFIDNNPIFEFRPSDYVNDPFIICKNEKMVAINSAELS